MIAATHNDQMSAHGYAGDARRGFRVQAPARCRRNRGQDTPGNRGGFLWVGRNAPGPRLLQFSFANRTPSPPGVRRGRAWRYPFIERPPADLFHCAVVLPQQRMPAGPIAHRAGKPVGFNSKTAEHAFQNLIQPSPVVFQSTSPSPLKLARDGIDEVQKFNAFGSTHDH